LEGCAHGSAKGTAVGVPVGAKEADGWGKTLSWGFSWSRWEMVFRPSFCSGKYCSLLFSLLTVYKPDAQTNQELYTNGRKPIRARYMKKGKSEYCESRKGGQKITKPELIEWNIMKAISGQKMTGSELIRYYVTYKYGSLGGIASTWWNRKGLNR
jgi:hypothetical protein